MEVKRIDIADAEMKQQKVKNVCAYCRVSTNILHQKGSYESQLEYYENMIHSKAGWNFTGIYADYGKSGTKEKGRTDFMRMLEDCEAGEIDIICTKSISRFARNTVECIQVVRKLKEMHIDVYFEKERIHTLSEKSELLLSIYSSVAQAESESISSNQKWSIQKRFLNGTYILPNPAYGYYTNENGLLELDQKQAAVVRFIFDEYLDGNGIWRIAKSLNEQKISTKKGKAAWLGGASRRIKTKELCENDMIKESELEKAFVTVRNKLSSNCDEILIPLMKELEDLQTTPMVREKLEVLEKQIQEQVKQRDILSRLAQEGHIDSAFYMEQQNIIENKLREYRKEKDTCLLKSKQRKESRQTKELIKLIQKESKHIEIYEKQLFEAVVKQVIVNPNQELVFILKNGLALTERREKTWVAKEYLTDIN